jgi:iron complex outermembrane recepter protein
MNRCNPRSLICCSLSPGSASLLLFVWFFVPIDSQGQRFDQGNIGSELGSSSLPAALPDTFVNARKETEDLLRLPLSVTAVPIGSLTQGHLSTTREASAYAPGVFINEFSARALSNPFFRGVGGSPANPGVTTYIDGVPQLNSYSSSIQLLDVDQVEFVRGPQGALFGRNTPGGLINITSRMPSPEWTADATALYGNYNAREARIHASGPLSGEGLTFGLAGGYAARDGYTKNVLTGSDIDSREAWFGKAQVLFEPGDGWRARLLLTAEQDRDGDYALGDLASLRRQPRRVARDFTDGYNDRDILSPTLQLSKTGEALTMESISGFVYWKNDGLTDLDYGVASPTNFFLNATRRNTEKQNQFTQEFRLASAADRPISMGESVELAWQSGLFLFYQDYEQETMNTFAPPLSMFSGSTISDLIDRGLGLYGQVKATVLERLEATAGLRFDVEDKDAELGSSVAPAVELDDSFREVSPQFGLVFHVLENQFAYATAAKGYKSGGFNPPPAGVQAPEGSAYYGTEHTWNYELGYRIRELGGRLDISAALFYTDWKDLQFNQQYPGTAGQYFIGNAGSAYSRGAELETRYRPLKMLDLFGSASVMEARFRSGSTAYNANIGQDEDIGGNRVPYAPEFKVTAGAEARMAVTSAITAFARAQVTVFGDFDYDASNAAGQDTYSLADFRAGLRSKNWFVEGWVANAFDTDYIPIAIPYAQLGAPSGYVGESGAPATFGLRAGLMF